MKYIIINHGYMGSNIENWFPWLKEKLDSKQIQVIIPQYPIDEDKHFYQYWKKVLDVYNSFEYINESSVVIGHSSGCAFSIKYLIENNLKIDKLILVSGFNNYFADDENDFHNTVNKTLYVSDSELLKIKELVNEVICIYGNNDPYISQDALHDFSKKLGALEIIINNGGHLNRQAGFEKLNEVLKHI